MTETAEVSNAGGNSNRNKFKRRNKKSRSLSNAKGFGKRGIYGRGTQIEQDVFSYFINIADAIRQGFETVDDKVTMANNVFEQTVDQEIHLSSNQVVSKVIENLIGFTEPEHFERFLKAFSENFRPICSDGYASHVMEKMIEICFLRAVYYKKASQEQEGDENKDQPTPAKRKKVEVVSEEAYNTTQKFSKSHRQHCSEFILKIGKFLLNNLEDFVWDPYASHIIRTSIMALSGIREGKVAFERNSKAEKPEKAVPVPEEWVEVVKEYINRLQMWPQYSELAYNTLAAQILAYIMIALRAIDKTMLKHAGKKILMESFMKVEGDDEKKKKTIEILDDDDKEVDAEKVVDKEQATSSQVVLPMVFNHESSIRLLETLLSIAGAKLFTQLNVMLFTGRIKMLALNRLSNFAVQKLIENVKEITEFESIFNELHDNIEDLLKAGHTGVVEALAKACLRLSTNQGSFVSSLLTALHISGSKEKFDFFVTCIMKLKPYEIAIDDKSQFIHLHGSLIMQHMLQFNKPIKLIQSILDMPSHDLAWIFSSAAGSYMADTFIRSKTIGEKSREKLLKHLEGNYLDMASTKFGSRVLENFFEVSNDSQKVRIVKELADKVNQLNGTLYGRVLYQKLRIETFRLSASQWKASFDKAKKAQTLFKDIIS